MAKTVDTLVTGGTVLTVNDKDSKLEGGALAIDKDTIVSLGSREDILSAYRGRVTIDVPGSIIMPRLIGPSDRNFSASSRDPVPSPWAPPGGSWW